MQLFAAATAANWLLQLETAASNCSKQLLIAAYSCLLFAAQQQIIAAISAALLSNKGLPALIALQINN